MPLEIKQYQLVIAYRLAKIVHAANYEATFLNYEMKVAEIGVALGQTSWYLLDHFPSMKMVLVDPHLRPPLRKVVERFSDRVEFIKAPSHEAASKVSDDSLDLVFIDAQHTYEHVKEDIHVWAPKLKDGGIMGGHDLYDASFPGVRQAVEETGLEYEADAGHTWWFKDCPKGKL